MSDFPQPRPFPYEQLCGSVSAAISYGNLNAAGSTALPVANKALFVPIRVPVQVTAYKLIIGGGSVAGGNYDVGIYDSIGNLLVSSGTQVKVTNAENVINITDTTFGPGLFYLAMSADATSTYQMITVSSPGVQRARLLGMLEQTSAFVLPNPATFAAITSGNCPAISVQYHPF